VPGYTITHKLGGGAFGIVFRAQKQSIGKDYAIKFLKLEDGEVARAVMLELEQVQHFAQVDHPNLVAIEDKGVASGIPYVVMGYAGSTTLRDRLPCKPEERPELLGLFLQACRGVQALHDRSLVHFDLKPGNVFLKGSVARVGDYGLSRLLTHSQASLTMGRGTPYYMAPELLRRKGDWRSDLYALGVMLYEILAGDVPFTGDNEWEVLKKHEQQPPRIPPELPANQRMALHRALAKDPEERLQSVGELMELLGASVSAGEALSEVRPAEPPPVLAAASAPAAVIRLPARPRRRRGTGFAVLLCMMVMFIAWQAVHGAPSAANEAWNFVQVERGWQGTSGSRATGDTFADKLRSFLAGAEARIGDASRKRRVDVSLKNLEWAREQFAAELDACAERLSGLAEAFEFSAGHAKKLELEGYTMFLAAVDYLQQLGYSDPDESRRGANVNAFLRQATGINGIDIACLAGASDSATARRNRVAADQWRRLAEQFCKNRDGWRALLQATGKTGCATKPARG
jgi:hypothetical protein